MNSPEIQRIRISRGDRLTRGVFAVLCVVFLVIFAYPMVYCLWASIYSSGQFSLEGYRVLLNSKLVLRGFANSMYYTLSGTAISLATTVPAAYALSREQFRSRRLFYRMLVLTNYFGGGILPTFLLVKKLGMLNTMWALVLPSCVSVYNTKLLISRFQNSLSQSVYKAAMLDGCGHWRYLLTFAVPLTSPSIATVTFSYFVSYYNAYFAARLYITKPEKFPLTIILNNLLVKNQAATTLVSSSSAQAVNTATMAEYALIIISSLPVMLVFAILRKRIKTPEREDEGNRGEGL